MAAHDAPPESWPPRPPEQAPEPGHERALARAEALAGRDGAWPDPSPAGPAGLIAHRALRRMLRPYAQRQGELDAAMVGAIRELAESMGAVGTGWRQQTERAVALATTLDPDLVEEVDTLLGPLWLSRSDNLVRPGLIAHRMYKPHVAAFLARAVMPGATVLNVGANVGWFSVVASRCVGRRGTVVAVEPGPDNLPLLRANLWRHRCDNTVVLPLAAYSRTGQVEMVQNPHGGAGNSIEPGAAAGALVPCARLDDLLGEQPVDVLKVDAVGSEDHAIRGLEATIARSPGITIVCEWWTGAFGGHGSRPPDVLAYYLSLGLSLALLTESGEAEPVTPHALLGMTGSTPFVTLVMRRG